MEILGDLLRSDTTTITKNCMITFKNWSLTFSFFLNYWKIWCKAFRNTSVLNNMRGRIISTLFLAVVIWMVFILREIEDWHRNVYVGDNMLYEGAKCLSVRRQLFKRHSSEMTSTFSKWNILKWRWGGDESFIFKSPNITGENRNTTSNRTTTTIAATEQSVIKGLVIIPPDAFTPD